MYQLPDRAISAQQSLSPISQSVWGLEDIASYVGASKAATRALVLHPKFPRPLANQSRSRRWLAVEVCDFFLQLSRGEISAAPKAVPNVNYVPKSIHVRQLKAVNS